MERKNVSLLLIGTSGNGISSTANTIIGNKQCITSTGSRSINSSVVKNSTKLNDVTINVVDVPGINTDNSNEEYLITFQSHIETSFTLCDNEFSSIILVLRYGQRFTKQEKDTLKFVTALFGKEVIEKNTVCAFTHGDMFEKDANHGAETLTFKKWCEEQNDPIKKELLQKCNYRCLLVNNMDVEKNNFAELLKLTDSTRKYLINDYREAEKWLKPLKNEMSLPKVRQKTVDFLDTTRSELLRLEEKNKDNNTLNDDLVKLLNKLKQFENQITEEVGEITDKAMHPVKLLQGLKHQIESRITLGRTEENFLLFEKCLNSTLLTNISSSSHEIKTDFEKIKQKSSNDYKKDVIKKKKRHISCGCTIA